MLAWLKQIWKRIVTEYLYLRNLDMRLFDDPATLVRGLEPWPETRERIVHAKRKAGLLKEEEVK